MSFFEMIGFGYTILATAIFTVEVIYCAAKGVKVLKHFVERGQGGPERRATYRVSDPSINPIPLDVETSPRWQ